MGGSQKILITGGTNGIGLHTAATLLNMGHHVVITGRSEQKLLEACASITELVYYQYHQNNLATMQFDLIDVKSVKEAVQTMDTDFDVIVLNAGVMFPRYAHRSHALARLDDTFLVNVLGNYVLVSEYMQRLPNKKPRLLLISSVLIRVRSWISFPSTISSWESAYSYDPRSGFKRYAQSKGCVALLAKVFELKLGLEAIVMHPGNARSGMVENMPGWQKAMAKMFSCLTTLTPLPEIGERVAHAAAGAKVASGSWIIEDQIVPLDPMFRDTTNAANLENFCEYGRNKIE